ncbi:MAG: universal stress protein [Bacteroidales bacterium]|nr:MAG: universal stress protein [Bacteroidales bacterium]
MKTIKMNKVLIALDYDPSAQKVAEVGFSLAKKGEIEFTILHVISEPSKYSLHKHITIMGFGGNNEVAPSQLESVDGLKNVSRLYLEKTKHHLGDNYIQTLVLEGDIAEKILATSKELNVDVIVLGFQSNKKRENLSDLSITENILHRTHIPLFIIPTDD